MPEGDAECVQLSGFTIRKIATDGEVVASTVDFSRIDQGLEAPASMNSSGVQVGEGDTFVADLRVELFTVLAGAEQEAEFAAQVLAATAGLIKDSYPWMMAQPGQLLAGVGILAMAGIDETITVKHGLLTVPWVWDAGVPRITEEPGHVFPVTQDDVVTADLGRMTVMLQLVLLTQEEYDYALTYGANGLQEALAAQGADVTDPRR